MTDERKTRRRKPIDPQLARLSIIVDQLQQMERVEREHAIGYILRRFAAAKPAEPESAAPTPNAAEPDRTM
jgi:hypothetical protein